MLVPLSLLTADPQTTLLHSIFSQWTGCGEEKICGLPVTQWQENMARQGHCSVQEWPEDQHMSLYSLQ